MTHHKKAVKERMLRERDRRTAGILEAARKVFVAEGYTKAIMNRIALEAGITKPTIYQYFKTKDELFFALMLPVIDDIRDRLGAMEAKLASRKYRSGRMLMRDLFASARHSYEMAPETFLIIQHFQETGLVGKMSEDISAQLNERGRYNFVVLRRVIRGAMKQRLIRTMDVDELTDVLWGLFVGIVHLEHIKAQKERPPKYLGPTLKVAEKLIADALDTGTVQSGKGKQP